MIDMGLFKQILKVFASCLPIPRRRKKRTSSQVDANEASPSYSTSIPATINLSPAYYGDDVSFASSESSEPMFIHVSRLSPAISNILALTEVGRTEAPPAVAEEIAAPSILAAHTDSQIPINNMPADTAALVDAEQLSPSSPLYLSISEIFVVPTDSPTPVDTEEIIPFPSAADISAVPTDSPTPVDTEEITPFPDISAVPTDSPTSVKAGEISLSPSVSDISTEATVKPAPREDSPTDFVFHSSHSVESPAPVPGPNSYQISPTPWGQSLLQLLESVRPPPFVSEISPSPSVQSLVVHTSTALSQVRSLECMRR